MTEFMDMVRDALFTAFTLAAIGAVFVAVCMAALEITGVIDE